MDRQAAPITVSWDDDAEVWVATSEEIDGLAVEAPTLEALEHKVVAAVSDLAELNGVSSVAGHLSAGQIRSGSAVAAAGTIFGRGMDVAVSAPDADRKFSQILRSVGDGHSFLVTHQGRAVARIIPADNDDDARTAAWAKLLTRLESQPVVNAGRWTREELYEEEP